MGRRLAPAAEAAEAAEAVEAVEAVEAQPEHDSGIGSSPVATIGYRPRVFAPDVRIEGFTCDDWQRVLELFRPLKSRGGGRSQRGAHPQRSGRGLVIALYDDEGLQKLVHSKVGRLRLDDLAAAWPVSAEELAGRHDASTAICMHVTALPQVMESLAERLEPADSTTASWLSLLQCLDEQMLAQRFDVWPSRLRGIPVPSEAMVERAIDAVCPVGKAMLIGLFDRDHLWTSVALRRGPQGFDKIVGPDDLRPRLGLLSGDFRRDHRHLARLVAGEVGPLSLGCFAHYKTFRQLEVDASPGAWALAVAVRDVVLSPAPPAVALPLGIDAGLAAFAALRDVASRFDSSGILAPAFRSIRDVAVAVTSGEEAGEFNALEVLRRLLARD